MCFIGNAQAILQTDFNNKFKSSFVQWNESHNKHAFLSCISCTAVPEFIINSSVIPLEGLSGTLEMNCYSCQFEGHHDVRPHKTLYRSILCGTLS